jgi:hypothetical protein
MERTQRQWFGHANARQVSALLAGTNSMATPEQWQRGLFFHATGLAPTKDYLPERPEVATRAAAAYIIVT